MAPGYPVVKSELYNSLVPHLSLILLLPTIYRLFSLNVQFTDPERSWDERLNQRKWDLETAPYRLSQNPRTPVYTQQVNWSSVSLRHRQ